MSTSPSQGAPHPSPSNKQKPACKHTVVAGRLLFTNAHQGTNKIALQGRLSATRRLRNGRDTVNITPTNASGTSQSQQLTFAIAER